MASPEQKLQAARLGNFAGTTGKLPGQTGLKKTTPEKQEELMGIVRQASVAAKNRKLAPLGGTRRRKMRKQTRSRKHKRK